MDCQRAKCRRQNDAQPRSNVDSHACLVVSGIGPTTLSAATLSCEAAPQSPRPRRPYCSLDFHRAREGLPPPQIRVMRSPRPLTSPAPIGSSDSASHPPTPHPGCCTSRCRALCRRVEPDDGAARHRGGRPTPRWPAGSVCCTGRCGGPPPRTASAAWMIRSAKSAGSPAAVKMWAYRAAVSATPAAYACRRCGVACAAMVCSSSSSRLRASERATSGVRCALSAMNPCAARSDWARRTSRLFVEGASVETWGERSAKRGGRGARCAGDRAAGPLLMHRRRMQFD